MAARIEYAWWVSALAVVAMISLSVWSPIDSENRRLEIDEKRQYKKIAVLISVIFLFVHLLLLLLGLKEPAVCIAVGLVLSAGLQLPCVVQSLRNVLK